MTKELTFQTGKITSDPKEGMWSAAFEFAPPSVSEKASRGVLTAAASISASEKFDATLAGHQILSALQESYYSQTTGGILPALERAVTAAHQRLVTLVFSGAGGEEAVDFNLVVGVLWGSVFYLAQLGEARAVILRGGELKLIGHRTGAEDGDLTVDEKPDIRTASGLLEVGDKIVLATPKFYDLVPAPELSRIMEKGGGEYIAGQLQEKHPDEPTVAGLVLTIGVEGGPVPTDEALIATEPAAEVKSEVAEDVPDEVAAEVTAVEEGKAPEVLTEPEEETPAETPEPAPAELSTAVAKDVDKLTDSAKGIFSGIFGLAGGVAHQGRRLAAGSNIPKLIKEILATVWDSLGKPRTAVEGVTEARNRRTLLVLAVVLLVVLLAGIGINSLTRGDTTKKDRFNNLVAAAQAQYDEASATASLNSDQAKSLLVSANERLNEADSLDVDDARVNSLRGQIGTLLEEVNQVYRVDPQTFFDVSTLRTGATGADLAGSKDTLYVLDPTGGLYQLTVADRTGTVLSSDLTLSSGQSLTQIGTNLYVYIPGQGVYGYNLTTKRLSQAARDDAAWGRITDWGAYTTNLYALDAGNSQIWRYTPASAAQLGTATVWMDDDEANLQSATAVAVDGSVWVGQVGDLLKFSRGTKEPFLLQDVIPALTNIKAVYATADTDNIYLLEPGRLVVTDKDGAYLAQYTSDKLQNATSLLVDEAGKKAYILAEKEIFLLELR